MKECIFCKKNVTPQWYLGPSCKSCYRKRYRLEHKEKYAQRDKENYEKNKKIRLEQAKEYYRNNSENIKSRTKAHRQKFGTQRKPGSLERWRSKNSDKIRAYSKKYNEKYPERRKKTCTEWNKRNKQYRAFMTAKRHAAKLQRTPKWLTKEQIDKIKEIYKNCPLGYDVDHIYPLQGELVSGLHVLENLQYLPSAENRSKSNKIPE